ncbi:MAG: ATP-binding protein [Alphaproteobacteria bacterium]|nr:ATP-binding protein [Alphaproteobacteria bacterium]
MKELSKCRQINNGENVILLGLPGVGKTHLAVALGIEAIKQGYPTLFMSTQDLLYIFFYLYSSLSHRVDSYL